MTQSSLPRTKARPIVSSQAAAPATEAVEIEHDPDSAESWGAFEETALSEADAWASNEDDADADPARR
jgi:type IV secretion system protein VirB1